jgi:hypothetical protein
MICWAVGLPDAQGLHHELVDEGVARMRVAGVAEDVFEFLGAEGVVALARGPEAGPAEEKVGQCR